MAQNRHLYLLLMHYRNSKRFYKEQPQNISLKRSFENLGIDISLSGLSSESTLASALQKNFFCWQKHFEKLEHLCSFLCLIIASVPSVPIRVSNGVHWCYRKRVFVFLNNNGSKNFCIFPSKTSLEVSFLSILP